jgi:hypothetical protein
VSPHVRPWKMEGGTPCPQRCDTIRWRACLRLPRRRRGARRWGQTRTAHVVSASDPISRKRLMEMTAYGFGNRSRGVDDESVRRRIAEIVARLVR